MSQLDSRIYIAGHRGMVGSAIKRRLESLGYTNILTQGRSELDLTRQQDVEDFLKQHRVDQVYLAAARVGGIHANSHYPADFLYDNLMIECNLIQAAHRVGVNKLLFLGSSCIYPRLAPQPIPEEALLTGPLEPTNEPYAIAKIAGIKLCESFNRQHDRDFRSVMPTNLYGPGDNFHAENAHVIPALLRRFYDAVQSQADQIDIWGSGRPLREFLHVDDLAHACVHLMELEQPVFASQTTPMQSHINIGSGQEVSIRELAQSIARIAGFNGRLVFDTSRPDGTPRKLLDISRVQALGWQPSIELETGLKALYRWFEAEQGRVRE
ncbi:GDP-L-fucose synthase [Marinobacterium sedimentorum]